MLGGLAGPRWQKLQIEGPRGCDAEPITSSPRTIAGNIHCSTYSCSTVYNFLMPHNNFSLNMMW